MVGHETTQRSLALAGNSHTILFDKVDVQCVNCRNLYLKYVKNSSDICSVVNSDISNRSPSKS